MRLFIEAPNGKVYYGGHTDVIYLKETMIEEEEPKRCETPAQVSYLLSKWFENPDNINCPFTLTTKDGDVHVFPPEILKRCIITVQAQTGDMNRLVPEGSIPDRFRFAPASSHPGDHSSPGLGYVPEDEETEEEVNQNETDRG